MHSRVHTGNTGHAARRLLSLCWPVLVQLQARAPGLNLGLGGGGRGSHGMAGGTGQPEPPESINDQGGGESPRQRPDGARQI
jgi:hypothetical protein